MFNFTNIAKEIAFSDLSQVITVAQKNNEAEILFSININKEEIYQKKKVFFAQKKFNNIYVIHNDTNYGHLSNVINEVVIKKLEIQDFLNMDINKLSQVFENSLIIMTNNIFAQIGIEKLGAIYEISPNSVWAIQDYDNHHWIENSIQACIFSDLYFPSHMDGELSLLSRINPNVPTFLPCGSNQWSKEFIHARLEDLISTNRSLEPLGKYYFYEKFIHRNKVINSLNSHFKSIGIVNKDFHQLQELEKWREWISHRLHWIIPTANDLPIRFFDALITGGIPIVPKSLIPYLNNLAIPHEYYRTYSSLDIMDPTELIRSTNNVFESGGESEILNRHEFAMGFYHIDHVIHNVITTANRYYVA